MCICHQEPPSPLAFVNEINGSGYHTPVLSLHICRNNRQQMGNKGFNIHTHTFTVWEIVSVEAVCE